MPNNHIDTLLGRNLIPIVRHSSRWYKFLENETSEAARGLIPGRLVKLFVVKSGRKNAYTFAADGYYYVTITDSLLTHIEKSMAALLSTEDVRQFCRDWLHVDYQLNSAGNAWITTFDESFEWALRFVLLHELAHIKLGHVDGEVVEPPEDLYLKMTELADRMTYGGDKENRHDRYNEFCADREAACWLFQLAMRRGVREPAQGTSHLGLASLGILATVLHISRHVAATKEIDESFTHQSFEARLEGIWEGMNLVLEDELTLESVAFMQTMMTRQRALVENLVFGAPSYYWISVLARTAASALIEAVDSHELRLAADPGRVVWRSSRHDTRRRLAGFFEELHPLLALVLKQERVFQ